MTDANTIYLIAGASFALGAIAGSFVQKAKERSATKRNKVQMLPINTEAKKPWEAISYRCTKCGNTSWVSGDNNCPAKCNKCNRFTAKPLAARSTLHNDD